MLDKYFRYCEKVRSTFSFAGYRPPLLMSEVVIVTIQTLILIAFIIFIAALAVIIMGLWSLSIPIAVVTIYFTAKKIKKSVEMYNSVYPGTDRPMNTDRDWS